MGMKGSRKSLPPRQSGGKKSKHTGGTCILPCVCHSIYQDDKYGKQMRVFNWRSGGKNPMNSGWRCTICKATKKP